MNTSMEETPVQTSFIETDDLDDLEVEMEICILRAQLAASQAEVAAMRVKVVLALEKERDL